MTAWYASILCVGLALFGGLVWFSLRNRMIAEIDGDLADYADRLERYFRAESHEVSGEQLRDELGEFSQGLPPGSALSITGDRFHFQYAARGTHPSFRSLHRVISIDNERYDLEVRTSTAALDHTLNLLRLLLVGLIPVVIAIACVGGAWLSGRVLKPVRAISAAARRISIESLSGRLPVANTGDEIAELSEVLNTMLERLESAVRTLSQFSADASHELRTPLAVIRTSAEFALRRPRPAESYRDSLQEIVTQAERMTALVENLLLLARSDTGASEMPLAAVDVREILKEVESEMRGLAELRGIHIRSEAPLSIPDIAGNRAGLHRLFLVLLDNALKYSDSNSQVNVRVQSLEGAVRVAIENGGPGIDSADVSHVFERFFRADWARSSDGSGNGGGFGLGLPLAQSIARQHGATIEVRSNPGQTTTFEVSFPARELPESAPGVVEPDASFRQS